MRDQKSAKIGQSSISWVFYAVALGVILGLSGCGTNHLESSRSLQGTESQLMDDLTRITLPTMDELDFNQRIAEVINLYQSDIDGAGAFLRLSADWGADQFGAKSAKSANAWLLMTYGGTVRVPEASKDGFTAILCHEMGHFFGGEPFLREGIAAEAQADFYAANVCLPRVFAGNSDAGDPASVQSPLLPNAVAEKCTAATRDSDESAAAALCVRSLRGAWTALNMSAARKGIPAPNFLTPDQSAPDITITNYPNMQCRLDTWLAGATGAARPRCWYNPVL